MPSARRRDDDYDDDDDYSNDRETSDNPVVLEIEYPERSSRLLALAALTYFPKLLLIFPHAIVLFFVQIAAMFVAFLGFVVVLFTGRYPRGMFDFLVGVTRWGTRVNAYYLGLTDKYPPFSTK